MGRRKEGRKEETESRKEGNERGEGRKRKDGWMEK
jgi:hypothetical protein